MSKAVWPYKNRCTLTAHRNGQWCKKIKGKLHYFGMIGDPDAAMKKYLDEADDLHNGQAPSRQPTTGDRLSVDYIVHTFLTRKQDVMRAGELAGRMYADYLKLGKLIQKTFGAETLVASPTPAESAHYGPRL